jgi:hypothetical protein
VKESFFPMNAGLSFFSVSHHYASLFSKYSSHKLGLHLSIYFFRILLELYHFLWQTWKCQFCSVCMVYTGEYWATYFMCLHLKSSPDNEAWFLFWFEMAIHICFLSAFSCNLLYLLRIYRSQQLRNRRFWVILSKIAYKKN